MARMFPQQGALHEYLVCEMKAYDVFFVEIQQGPERIMVSLTVLNKFAQWMETLIVIDAVPGWAIELKEDLRGSFIITLERRQ